jgi:hypothetical protein
MPSRGFFARVLSVNLYPAFSAPAASLLLLLAAITPVTAQCPSAQNPKQAYLFGVGNESTSEVYRLDTGETRVVSRYKTGRVVEQTLYEGLIRTEHLDRGRRTTYAAKDDLRKLFPLKVGQVHVVQFDAEGSDGKKRLLRAEYRVVAKDHLIIGPCRYDVLKIEHSNRFDEGPLIFINTDWYAPDIKMILAREYKLRGGGSEIRKIDAISLKKDEK